MKGMTYINDVRRQPLILNIALSSVRSATSPVVL
jgi:hypothetical protein